MQQSYTELKKKRAFRKFSYRGVDLDQYVWPPGIQPEAWVDD